MKSPQIFSVFWDRSKYSKSEIFFVEIDFWPSYHRQMVADLGLNWHPADVTNHGIPWVPGSGMGRSLLWNSLQSEICNGNYPKFKRWKFERISSRTLRVRSILRQKLQKNPESRGFWGCRYLIWHLSILFIDSFGKHCQNRILRFLLFIDWVKSLAALEHRFHHTDNGIEHNH